MSLWNKSTLGTLRLALWSQRWGLWDWGFDLNIESNWGLWDCPFDINDASSNEGDKQLRLQAMKELRFEQWRTEASSNEITKEKRNEGTKKKRRNLKRNEEETNNCRKGQMKLQAMKEWMKETKRSEINPDCQQRSCRTYRAFGIHYLKGGTNDASSNEEKEEWSITQNPKTFSIWIKIWNLIRIKNVTNFLSIYKLD